MRFAILALCALSSLPLGAPAGAESPPSAGVGFERSSIEVRHPDGTRRAQLFVWYPSPTPPAPIDYGGQLGWAVANAPVTRGAHPFVVFSHGYLGAADQSLFLTESLARSGYVVAALDHADASRGNTNRTPPEFANPEAWDEAKFRDRADDVRAVVDTMLARSRRPADRFTGAVDASRIAGVGHSLGGYTLLAVSGARPSWRDDRLRAFVLLSPYVAPFAGKRTLDASGPVMLQGGTLDLAITPGLPAIYAKLGAPKYYAVLRGENHFGWTNLACLGRTTTECAARGNPHEIVALTRAFLDRHARGLPAKRLNKKGDLATYRAKLR